jgi:hypothetical protein
MIWLVCRVTRRGYRVPSDAMARILSQCPLLQVFTHAE